MGRLASSVVRVTISVVLRLVERALAGGRLAGEAEIVETGERGTVRDGAELVDFLNRKRPPVASVRTGETEMFADSQDEGRGGSCG